MDDRILLFLMRMRRRVPFEGLALQFGISTGTASNTYYEMLALFHEHIVPRLLSPLSGDQIDEMTPAQFKDDLPGAKFIVDLTAFPCKNKENVLLSRYLYSAYHHRTEAGAVFGMLSSYVGSASNTHLSTDLGVTVIIPNGLFVYRTKLFGGMAAEVLTMFNKSDLMEKLRGTQIRNSSSSFIFSPPMNAAHGVVPAQGLAPGVKIAVGDTAYARASGDWEGRLYLPTKQPEDGSNLQVQVFFSTLTIVTCDPIRGPI